MGSATSLIRMIFNGGHVEKGTMTPITQPPDQASGNGNASISGARERVMNFPLGGPGKPPEPAADIEQPLTFEYMPGVNLTWQPRSGFGLLTFDQLRNLSDYCQEIRLPIEVLKREIRALEWDIVPRDRQELRRISPERRAEIEAARGLLERPDGQMWFDRWTNSLLDDVLTVDAATLYPVRSRGGKLMGVRLIDGTTIRPLIDDWGREPAPPLPAYLQTVRGMCIGLWTRKELIYLPYNTETRSPYGRPPSELVIMTLNLALRMSSFKNSYYSEGNVPEALVGLPEFTVDQVADYQEYFDALLAGDVARLRRIKFMPVKGSGGIPVHEFRRPDGQVTLDEWLLRLGCWAVGVSPAELGLMPGGGLGGKGYAEGQADIQYRLGLGPLAQYLKGIYDWMLAEWGYPHLAFRWVALQLRDDALKQAQVDQIYVMTGIRQREDIAAEHGWEAPEDEPRQPNRDVLRDPGRGEYVKAAESPLTRPLPDGERGGDLHKAEAWPDDMPLEVQRALEAAMSRLEIALRGLMGERANALMAEVRALGQDEFVRRVASGQIGAWVGAEVESVLAAEMERMARFGADSAGAELQGVSFALPPDQARQWAAGHAAELVTEINMATRDLLRDAVADALGRPGGVDYAGLTDAISELLDDSTEYRARRIAQTEVVQSYHNGSLQAWRASGVVWGKRWVGGQAGICRWCQALDGQVQRLGRPFTATVNGVTRLIQEGELVHPNDRCRIAPVTYEEARQNGWLMLP